MRSRDERETKRCPWCQYLIPGKTAGLHRCPAKPQTYFPEDLRFVASVHQRPSRRPRP